MELVEKIKELSQRVSSLKDNDMSIFGSYENQQNQ